MIIAQLKSLNDSGLFNLTELARLVGIEPQTLMARVRRGGPELTATESTRMQGVLTDVFRRIGVDIRFGEVLAGKVTVRCVQRSEDDFVDGGPNDRDVVTIEFPYEVSMHRSGYLRDAVHNVTIRVAFSRTLFAMMRNRDISKDDILKMAYVKSQDELIGGLVTGSIDGDDWFEIVFASNEISALLEIDPAKVSLVGEFTIDLEELRRRWNGKMGFQIAASGR